MEPFKVICCALRTALKVSATVMLTTMLLCAIATTCVAQSSNPPAVYTPSYVAASGAVGTNAAFEVGKSTVWYIELQRYGADYIEAGIAKEDPSVIALGIQILNDGVQKEASDGSFPGAGSPAITAANANSATGAVFHSTSLFFEGLGRACLDLQNYNPATYALAPGTYASQIAAWSPKLEATAQWLTNTSWTPPGGTSAINVAALGYTYDTNYTHRYALLSAGLQECSDITGDTNLVTGMYGVNWWIDQYFTKQLGAGWTGALPQTTLDGGNTPATLVAPGGTAPAGTGEGISALGVLPEAFGYDVSYHMVDVLHFTRWYEASSDATRKANAPAIITNALQWERSRESALGVVDMTGSSRVGVELNQNGVGLKQPSLTEMQQAFLMGACIDGNSRDTLGGILMRDTGVLPNGDAINANGAVCTNANFDSGAAATYNLTLQKDAAYWVSAGILHENDAQIQQGLKILQWGFSRQASDGSFPGTCSKYSDVAVFLEVAARCVQMVQNYNPTSHPATASLLTQATALIPQIDLSQNYLAGPLSTSGYVSTTSASKVFSYAAALGETSVVTQSGDLAGSMAAQTLSLSFLAKAEALVGTDGTCLEAGAFVPNSQAASIGQMENLLQYGALATPQKSVLSTLCASALTKEESVIRVNGTFTFSNPATQAIETDFEQAQAFTANPAFTAWYQRMSSGGNALSWDFHP